MFKSTWCSDSRHFGWKNVALRSAQYVIAEIQGEHKVFPWLQKFVTRKLRGIQKEHMLKCTNVLWKKKLPGLSYILNIYIYIYIYIYVRIPRSFLVIRERIYAHPVYYIHINWMVDMQQNLLPSGSNHRKVRPQMITSYATFGRGVLKFVWNGHIIFI